MASAASTVSSAPPPEAESIVSLTKVAGILALIFGIIAIFFGAFLIIVLVGIVPLIASVLDILIYTNCTEIIRLVEEVSIGGLGENISVDDNRIHIWRFNSRHTLLVAYLRYDELLRYTQIQTATTTTTLR